ncbi:uncharacterized protein FOMMEDRAFT_158878 [Fomitiporia mediterranea MF3/22]|uniref:uncharacterized protein n=1 Tax=Fomitiporia mediterranea (strain MF3/22) TaxID=694068 RepID=UPI000440943D|nr:uncharacterized protein FOMMEDRAFT_158878 [Fomitiporia mediterranea MF3/22]EJD01723.1 hypothetical protein FOMMEDRAFT_158878 [Fomitiporia mediterranea MF3/22]
MLLTRFDALKLVLPLTLRGTLTDAKVIDFEPRQSCQEKHSDAIWGIHWTPKDRIISISADGTVKQFDASSGQTISSRPAHPVGIVSLSVDEKGEKSLFNSLEGRTVLWNLENGEVEGQFDSFVKSGSGENDPAWSVSLHPSGETYASTGGTGNVTIHSAESSNFGERVAKLESGRSKMGMCCTHTEAGLAEGRGQRAEGRVQGAVFLHPDIIQVIGDYEGFFHVPVTRFFTYTFVPWNVSPVLSGLSLYTYESCMSPRFTGIQETRVHFR